MGSTGVLMLTASGELIYSVLGAKAPTWRSGIVRAASNGPFLACVTNTGTFQVRGVCAWGPAAKPAAAPARSPLAHMPTAASPTHAAPAPAPPPLRR